jgi:RNA polymerase sigma-70 factor (ECF subfamily)
MSAEAINGRIEAERSNEAKLAGLYEEYYGKIAHYAYVRIGNKTEAEDIAGEVFLRALDSLKSYKERGIPMQAWLFRIAHNLVVDHLRKMTKQKTVPIDTVQVETDADPVTVVETNIEITRVTKAMEELTGEQREVLRLRFFGGLTSKETGSILKKSDGAVREMQRAGIEKLRKLLVAEQ